MRRSSMGKKIASVFLAAAMILTAVPVSGAGFENNNGSQAEASMEELPIEGTDTPEDMPELSEGFQEAEIPDEITGFQTEAPEEAEGFSAEEPLKTGDYSAWFDGGDGTQAAPYLISTAEQVKKIYDVYLADNAAAYYYKLTKDIDLSTALPEYQLNSYKTFAGIMKGELDGAGHRVYGAGKYQALIGILEGTVKNLTWHVEDAASLAVKTNGVSAIEDVKITGHVRYTAGHGNESPLLFVSNGEKLTMKNVRNEADIEAYGAALYNGIFIGYTGFMYDSAHPTNSPQKREYVFENCVNTGSVIGDRIAMFFGNATNMEEALNGSLKHEGEVKKELSITVTNCLNTGSITGVEDARYLAATMGNSAKLNALEDQIVSENSGLTKTAPNFQVVNVGDEYKFEVDSKGNGKISIGSNSSNIATIEVNLITYVSMFDQGVYIGSNRYFIQEKIPVTQGVTEYRSPLKKLQITDDDSAGITYTGTGGSIAMTDGKYYFEPSDTRQILGTFGKRGTKTPEIYQVNLYDGNGVLKGIIESSPAGGELGDIPSITAATGASIGDVAAPTAGAAWTEPAAAVVEGGQIFWEKNGSVMIPVQVNGVPDLESVSLDATKISLAPGGKIELLAEITPQIEGVTYQYAWSSDHAYVKVEPDPQDNTKAVVSIDSAERPTDYAVVVVAVSSDISATKVKDVCAVNVTTIAAQVPKIDKNSDITSITEPIAGVEKGDEANRVKEELETLMTDIVQTGSPYSGVQLSGGTGTNAAQEIQNAVQNENATILTVVETKSQDKNQLVSGAETTIQGLANQILKRQDGDAIDASYVDISISVKKVSSSGTTTEIAKITELPENQELPVTVALPKKLQQKKVIVVAFHDGKAIQIKGVTQKEGFLNIPARFFSPYALVDAGNTFTVNFETAGGLAVASQEVSYNNQVSKPADPSWASHVFEGWFEDADYTIPWDFDANTITGDVTLYAKWSSVPAPPAVNLYTVTFDSQGGSAVSPVNDVREYMTIGKPADPVRENYVFDGWFKDAACTQPWDFAKDTVNKNITLYAKWTEKDPEPDVTIVDPVTVKVDSKTTGAVTISWSVSANAEGYTVWAREEGQNSYKRVAIISKDEARSFTWKKRDAGTKHFFVVKGWIKDEDGKYVFSQASKTVRGTTKPKAADIQRVTVNKAGDMKVTLKGAAKGANRYAMCWSWRADFGRYAIGIRTQYTSRTMVKAQTPGTYYVKVRSYRQMGKSRVYGDWSKAVKVQVNG